MSEKELRVHLFGVMSLSCAGKEIQLPNTAIARRLLAYLLLQKERRHNRSVVAGKFWGEMPETKARKSLSQALWHIRQSLPELIAASSEEIFIANASAIWTDTHEFERHITAPLSAEQENIGLIDLSTALDLYRGELLEGIYDDWVLLERERYSELYLRGIEQLAKLEKMNGGYQRALELTQQLLKLRPYDESFHQEAMRLYYLLGKADAAIRQYESCCQVLRDEFDVEPEAKTVLLAQEITRQSAQATSAYLPKPIHSQKPINLDQERATALALIGREEPRALLLQHVEALFQGQGGLILIEGEAGIGKTRLLREIAQDAEWRNAQTLWGHCTEQERNQAFGPLVTAMNQGLSPLRVRQLSTVLDPLWMQVLKPLLPQIAQTLPDLDAPPPLKPEQERARVLEAMANFITGWAAITPLLLLIEDLHWADADSLNLLPVLQNRLNEHRILLIGTFRREDAKAESSVWVQLQALDRAGLRERLLLEQLSQQATSKLIQRYLNLPRSAPVFEKRIHEETGGNPLFVLETLRTLEDEGLLTQDEAGGWKTPWDTETVDYSELPLPPMVEQLIERRLARLSPRSRQILNAGVVLGHQFDFSLLVAMLELNATEILAPVQDLVNRSLWEETEEGYQFSHDKVRQVSLQALDDDHLKQLHQKAIDVFEAQAPENVDALAYHCEQGGSLEKAAKYAYQAGLNAIQAHAYAAGRTHLEKTLDFLDQVNTETLDRFSVLAAYEKTLDVLGDRDEQKEILDRMNSLISGDAKRAYVVSLRSAWRLAFISDFDGAQEAGQRALTQAEELDDLALQADALDALGTALSWQGNNEEAVIHLSRAVALAEKLNAPQTEAHNRASLGSALLGVKKYDDAKRELLRSIPLMEENPRELADSYNLLGIIYMEQGRSDEAIEAYKRSLENSQKIGYLYGQGRALVNLGTLDYFQGRFGTTLSLYDQAILIFAQIEQKRGEVQLRLNRASMSQTFFGDSEQVVADAEFCLAYGRASGDLISCGQALTVLGESRRQAGDFLAASEYLNQAKDEFEKTGDRWMLLQVYGVQSLVKIDQGCYEDALERAQAAVNICEEIGASDMISRMLTAQCTAWYFLKDYEKAHTVIKMAIDKMTSGVENPSIIHYWHAKVLAALGQNEEATATMEKAYQALQDTLANLSPEYRQISLQNMADHRAIVEAWEGQQANKITVNMPGVAGGTVEVLWTVDAPEDEEILKKVARRRHQLQRLLQEANEQGGAPTYQHLADALLVGLRTIERDMAALAEE